MTEIASTSGLVESARKLMNLFDLEVKTAEEIRANNPIFTQSDRLTAMDLQNITRSAICAKIWKREGRTALAMHPAVVEEVAVASSDKISGQVLRTLPYLSPLVIYASPPEFPTWVSDQPNARPYEQDWYKGKSEHTMRLLGFLTCGHGTVGVGEKWLTTRELPNGMHVRNSNRTPYELFEEATFNTHDTRAHMFGVMAVFEIFDATGKHLDYEMNTLSMPFASEMTLTELVDDLIERFEWTTAPGNDPAARKWMRRIMSTIVGTLFYLCSTTLEAEPLPRKQAAKIRPGMRKPMDVYKVGWKLGAALTRLRHLPVEGEDLGPSQTQEPQHRRGHFRRQWYGPRDGQLCVFGRWCECGGRHQELIFVSPYWTHRERLGEEGTNTLRRVPRVGPKGSAGESVRDALNLRP